MRACEYVRAAGARSSARRTGDRELICRDQLRSRRNAHASATSLGNQRDRHDDDPRAGSHHTERHAQRNARDRHLDRGGNTDDQASQDLQWRHLQRSARCGHRRRACSPVLPCMGCGANDLLRTALAAIAAPFPCRSELPHVGHARRIRRLDAARPLARRGCNNACRETIRARILGPRKPSVQALPQLSCRWQFGRGKSSPKDPSGPKRIILRYPQKHCFCAANWGFRGARDEENS